MTYGIGCVIGFKYLFQYVKTYMTYIIGCVIGFSIYFSMLQYVFKQLENILLVFTVITIQNVFHFVVVHVECQQCSTVLY